MTADMRGALVQRLKTRRVWELVLWGVGVVAWLYLGFKTDWNLLAISVWSVPFLLMTSAATTPWRSVTWSTIGSFFMLGFGPIFALSALAQALLSTNAIESLLRNLLEGLDIFQVNEDFLAPITEEFLKVLPLLVLFWWRRGGFRDMTGPIDYAVLAGATGAGLAFAEDTFVYIAQGLQGPTSDIYALGLGPVYGNIVGATDPGFSLFGNSTFADVGSFFFPEMQDLFGFIWSGHGALAFGIGLALGLGVWLRRRTGNRWWYALPVAAYVWAVFEHVMANWYGGAGCSAGGKLLCTLAAFDLQGRIFPILILVGFGYAIYASRTVLRSHRGIDSSLLLPWSGIDQAAYRSRGWAGWPALVGDRFDFLRWRRKTAYSAFHLEQTRPVTKGMVMGVLAARTQTLRLRERLEGSSPTTIPDRIEKLIDSAAPIA